MIERTAGLETSPALIVLPTPKGQHPNNTVGVYDFLSKNFAYLSPHTFYWFEYFKTAKSWAQVLQEHLHLEPKELLDAVDELVVLEFLVDPAGPSGMRNARYRKQWKWDLSSALFHFTVIDSDFHDPTTSATLQRDKLEFGVQPPTSTLNSLTAVQLPSPLAQGQDFFKLLLKRRTNRTSAHHCVSPEELSVCLFSGLGIVGHVQTPVGDLPLSTKPSGGARNAYEAYVIVNRGVGIQPGAYHYSALQNSLERIDLENQNICLASCLAQQTWATDMASAIILVANFDRLMWKYDDPNAYRVACIEAGHIGQNIMLAATAVGLCACPTAALSHTLLSQVLKLDSVVQSPVYALTLDRSLPYADQFRPNHLLDGLADLLRFEFGGRCEGANSLLDLEAIANHP